jgi:hypothetical protein
VRCHTDRRKVTEQMYYYINNLNKRQRNEFIPSWRVWEYELGGPNNQAFKPEMGLGE